MPVALPLLWLSTRALVETSLWGQRTLVASAFSVGEGMLHFVPAAYALLPAVLQAAVRLAGIRYATDGVSVLHWQGVAPLQTSRIPPDSCSIPLGHPGRHSASHLASQHCTHGRYRCRPQWCPVSRGVCHFEQSCYSSWTSSGCAHTVLRLAMVLESK